VARQIDIDNLTPSDRAYIDQRPWMIQDIERLHGVKYEDLDFHDEQSDGGSDGDGQSNANLDLEQEVAVLRRQVAGLQQERDTLKAQLETAQQKLSDAQDAVEPDTDSESDNDEPYDTWEYADLQHEVAQRNEAYEEAGQEDYKISPASRKGPDLVAALEQDDRDRAERDA
jgi:chromosome segregation ATPase